MSRTDHPEIRFGTDGWRGIIAEDFTFDNVRICAQGVSNYILSTSKIAQPEAVIGYDTRFASADFARTVAEVMAGNGIRVIMSDSVCATPALSYGTASRKAAAGIMITASHNPPNWNGIKIKSTDGSSISPQAASEIEKIIADIPAGKQPVQADFDESLRSGRIETADLNSSYITALKDLADIENLKKTPLNVVLDCMYGSGANYLPRLFEGGKLAVTEINRGPNPAFPGIRQPEPIMPNLSKLTRVVAESNASVGLATDGDADRLGVVDENGRYLSTLQVFSLLVLYFLEIKGERGAIVKTITSSQMIDRLGELYKVPVYEVPVGFKYVAPAMVAQNAMIGGEESGGYGYRGHVLERDGILSGVFFLDYMAKTGMTPSQLVEMLYNKVGPHYYEREDCIFAPTNKPEIINSVQQARPESIAGEAVIKRDDFDGVRFLLSDRSWLLIRFSGTEPLLRIYAEAGSPQRAAELIQEGKTLAGLRGG